MNYEEIWYTKTIERSYDVDQSKVVDKTINGFDAFRTYSFFGNHYLRNIQLW
jgi:hypothetical protein